MVPIEIEWVTVSPPAGEAHPGFHVARYPVTVAQYRAFMDAGGYRRKELWSERGWGWREQNGFEVPSYWGRPGYDGSDLPVTGVSFWEAEAFAAYAGARLPNESEWYLISSNFGKTRYPWGDSFDGSEAPRANLNFFGALDASGRVQVDSFPAGRSLTGVWDLLGNVSEWCLPGESDAVGPEQLIGVLRGGCSWHTPVAVDSTFRDEVGLNTRDNQTGIRLIRRQADSGARSAPRAATQRHPTKTPSGRTPRSIARPTTPFRQEGIPEQLEESDWRLVLNGQVANPVSLSLAELKETFPRTLLRGLFVCVCRWGEINEFAGVALRDLMQLAGPIGEPAELYLRQRSVPGSTGKVYESTVSLGEALVHDAVLAYEMDGRPLTKELGWPLRLVDLHLYGYKTLKCLAEITVTRELIPGWWEQECQYDPRGIVQPGRITVLGARPYPRTITRPGLVELEEGEIAPIEKTLEPEKVEVR